MARLELVPPGVWHGTRDRSRPSVLAERRARTLSTPFGPVVLHGPETLRHAVQELVRAGALGDLAPAQGWLDQLLSEDALVLSSGAGLRDLAVEDSAGLTVARPAQVPGLAWAWRAQRVAAPVAVHVDGVRVPVPPGLRELVATRRRA